MSLEEMYCTAMGRPFVKGNSKSAVARVIFLFKDFTFHYPLAPTQGTPSSQTLLLQLTMGLKDIAVRGLVNHYKTCRS